LGEEKAKVKKNKRESVDIRILEIKENLIHFKEVDAGRVPDLPESAISP
jgi:hypothetical protein